MFTRKMISATFSALALLLMLVVPVLAAPGDMVRVSVDSGGVQGNNVSADPSISADGRYVAFYSNASNLVAGDTNGVFDAFVHDRTTGGTVRVSVDSDGAQGDDGSYNPSISADGRFVAFVSTSTNLVAGDTNGQGDVFVHDLTTGTTSRVSVDSDGVQGNNASYIPTLSADGRYVAFYSYASNLVAGDTNGIYDVFLHDRTTGDTVRVSVDSGGAQGNSGSGNPSISADGRYVAFYSYASNLVAGDTNGREDVFVYDRTTGATRRVSVDSGGAQGNSGSNNPSISADGRYVAFSSFASNLVAGDTNGALDAFVHDRTTGATTRVSVDSSGIQGNNISAISSISADGRYVAFSSYASNLVTGDTNGVLDAFVHDRTTGVTRCVSVDSSGAQGNLASTEPSLSADGRYVAFYSIADNLVAEDTNDATDIFVHESDVTSPTVIFGAGSIPPSDGANLATGPSTLVVQFSEDVLSDGSQHAANSGWNYLLVGPGPNGAFDTTIASGGICDSDHVVDGDDVRISIDSISYTAGSFTATLHVNGGVALSNGQYRLYVCGAASIWDLSSMPLNGGANAAITFTVGGAAPVALPATGFAPGEVTLLPGQVVSYTTSDLWLEIPRLAERADIVGVPQSGGNWDVAWLGSNAGWLQGTAFPTWAGNSVLTGHVYDANGQPGPFVNLNQLWYGDRIIVHAFGQQYVYEVRSVRRVTPDDTQWATRHEDLPWLTLITCKGYDQGSNSYRYRVVVRAVQVEIR